MKVRLSGVRAVKDSHRASSLSNSCSARATKQVLVAALRSHPQSSTPRTSTRRSYTGKTRSCTKARMTTRRQNTNRRSIIRTATYRQAVAHCSLFTMVPRLLMVRSLWCVRLRIKWRSIAIHSPGSHLQTKRRLRSCGKSTSKRRMRSSSFGCKYWMICSNRSVTNYVDNRQVIGTLMSIPKWEKLFYAICSKHTIQTRTSILNLLQYRSKTI